MQFLVDIEPFYRLGLALGIGLLIGTERGWHSRELHGGSRAAGIRTFALLGLFGGISGQLALIVGDIFIGLALLAAAVLTVTAHAMATRQKHPDYGVTTVVAAILTFTLGAMATRGSMPLAATAGVVTVLLLQVKPTLHRWVSALQRYELEAALKLLLISVVVLPILPDQGFGPGGIFNPFQLWWMVVLISGISFVGYVAIKFLGPRRGTLMTGLFGGLASSTALTVSFSRLARGDAALNSTLAAGIALAAGMMFIRILLVVGIVNQQLFVPLTLPLGLMGGVCILGAVVMAVTKPPTDDSTPPMIEDPAEIGMAVKFALFLVAVIFLSHVMRQGFGDAGVFAIAGIAGLADVDAITLSIARMTENDIPATSASGAIIVAALVNTLVKGGIVIVIGGRALAWRVLSVLLTALGLGVISINSLAT